MRSKISVYAAGFSLLLLLQMAPPNASSLSIEMTNPLSGDISHETNVTVQGTSWGTDFWCNGTNFTNASGDCIGSVIVTEPKAGVTLQRSLYDDFEDCSFCRTAWVKSTSDGQVSESDGILNMSVNATLYDWGSYAIVSTAAQGYTDLSADIKIHNYSGTIMAYVEFYQDNTHYARVGYEFNQTAKREGWYHYYYNGNQGGGGWSSAQLSGFHNVRLMYDNVSSIVYMYGDGTFMDNEQLTLSNYEARLVAISENKNDCINASFDNVWTGYCVGFYYSEPIDTRMPSPVLWNVNWTASALGGSSASVQLHSSDTSEMDIPTNWAVLKNQANCSSLSLKRYIQYKIVLKCLAPGAGPLFQSIYIQICIPVQKVEVSLNGLDWIAANGTTCWSGSIAIPDGNRTIHCRATDAMGDMVKSSVNMIVDTVPPAASILIDDGGRFAGESLVSITVGWSGPVEVAEMWISNSAIFSEDGRVPYQNVTKWNLSEGDGPKRVYCMVIDRYGLFSSRTSAEITLDTTNPACNLTIEDGARMTVDGQVNLAISASDAFGVVDMQISNDAAFNGAGWAPFASEAVWNLTAGPGVKTVHLRVRDNAGHLSRTVSKTIVRIADGGTGPLPTANMTVNDDSGFATQRAVTVNISMEGATAQWMMLCNDCEFRGRKWDAFSNSIPWVLMDGDGNKTIFGRFATGEGRIFCSTVEVVLDTMPPEGFFTINGGEADTLSPSVRLDLNGTDDNGVSKMMIGNSPDFSGARWEPYSARKNWTLPGGDGKKTVYVLFRDPSGLVSQFTSASILLDTDRPVPNGSVTINGGRPYTNSATVSLSLRVDDTFETRSVRMMICNEANFSGAIWEKFRSTKDWVLSPGDGNKTVHVVFEADRMRSEILSGAIVLDTVAPALPVLDAYNHTTEKSSIRLSGTAEPAANLDIAGNTMEAGPDGRFSVEVRLDKGQNDLKIIITDAAGNSNSDEITVERIEFKDGQPLQVVVQAAIALVIIIVLVTALLGWRMRAKRKPTAPAGNENGKPR